MGKGIRFAVDADGRAHGGHFFDIFGVGVGVVDVLAIDTGDTSVDDVFVLFTGAAASVVVDNDLVVRTFRSRRNGSTAEEKRSVEYIPRLEGPVFKNELSVEEWVPEEAVEGSSNAGTAKDGTKDLGRAEVVELKIGGALPDDDHDQDTSSEGTVGGDGEHSDSEGVAAFKNTVLCDQKDASGESTGNSRGDEPRGDDFSETVPTPVDFLSAISSDTSTDDTADDGVGSRDWGTETSSESEPGGRSDEGASHCKH